MNDSRLEALRAMLADDPADAFTRYALAMELKGQGDTEQALQEFASVLEGDPSYLPTYYQYGALLHSSGESERALDVIRRGIAAAQAGNDAHTRGELEDLLDEVDG